MEIPWESRIKRGKSRAMYTATGACDLTARVDAKWRGLRAESLMLRSDDTASSRMRRLCGVQILTRITIFTGVIWFRQAVKGTEITGMIPPYGSNKKN